MVLRSRDCLLGRLFGQAASKAFSRIAPEKSHKEDPLPRPQGKLRNRRDPCLILRLTRFSHSATAGNQFLLMRDDYYYFVKS